MRILIVGGGGREHAIAWRMQQDDPAVELIAAPGNPGIAALARCRAIPGDDVAGLADLAVAEQVDFTIVGPELPLAAGIVDLFRERGLAIFGPTRAAAEIETSKAWAKDLLRRHGIPTADAALCTTAAEAREAIARFGAPVVIKASGLAAGKGVIVAMTPADAEAGVATMFESDAFGDAASTVLVEEFMEGEELSLFVITDGERAVPLVPAQDHKRLGEGDHGPNTGGMGAYAPVGIAGHDEQGRSPLIDDILDRIVHPTLQAMRAEGRPFTGLLYAGLMLTADGPRVVEFNCRFGDPETQAVLPILDASPSLLELMRLVATGQPLPADARIGASASAVTTVLAARGYPERPEKGAPITIPAAPEGVLVFHAGTARSGDALVTAGGRVLTVTGVAARIEDAAAASREFAEQVTFAGRQFRRDIGWRELARTGARAS